MAERVAIVGRSGSGKLANLPAPRIGQLRDDLMVLAGDYDRVIIDLGAGVETGVRALAGDAGTILVLATAEPTALTDAYAFIKLTVADRRDADIRVVVNLAASHREGERTYHTMLKACQNFLGISPPLAGVVRRDTKVADSIRNQTPRRHRQTSIRATPDAIDPAKGRI